MPLAVGFAIAAQVQPVLWVSPQGQFWVGGEELKPHINPGARAIRDNAGIAYDFDGTRGGILFGDAKPLRLGANFTVSTWLNLRAYVTDGPGAQVLFRGDDRVGVDPFTVVIHPDGTINFSIQNDQDQGVYITAEMPLQQWVHVLGSFDSRTGEMTLWMNGEKVAYRRTSKRQFVDLDPAWAPGVSVGNVQNEKGPHNQPINGKIADLRLYDQVLTPEEVGYAPHIWDQPPLAMSQRRSIRH